MSISSDSPSNNLFLMTFFQNEINHLTCRKLCGQKWYLGTRRNSGGPSHEAIVTKPRSNIQTSCHVTEGNESAATVTTEAAMMRFISANAVQSK